MHRCIMMLASCALIVTSMEERLLIGDTALQSEIQELRSKVTSLEKKVSFLETKSSKFLCLLHKNNSTSFRQFCVPLSPT